MKAGVEAGALGCMAAYNEIDGIHAMPIKSCSQTYCGMNGALMA